MLCESTDIEYIYNHHIIHDFPKAEVKPLSRILELHRKGVYFAYALYSESNQLLSYAFLCSAAACEYVLLDYLAVSDDIRGKGIGTNMLELLKAEICKTYTGILLESENPDFALDKADFDIRSRRISFYEKCGFHTTKMLSRLFGVEYCVLVYAPEIPSTLNLAHATVNLYRTLIPEKHLAANVSLRISEVF